ncbi:MAG: hypothetical protein IPQ09_06125 [Myxococcales bacterium]|jgi:hypothetical protein|nr:hypothetical protein [Myxococcales bacterium]
MHTERLSLARGLTPVTWLASIASMAVAIVSITGCSRAEEARFPSGTTDPPRSVARSDAPIPAFDAPTQEELSLRGEEQGASKPRLSRTLRLGADESVYARPTAAAAPGSGGVTVIVNNNISQTQQTVVSTGGGYGRGYYGAGLSPYGTAGGYTGSRNFGTSPGASPLPQPQAPSSVPRVGGDWAAPRNYGPPAMR